jgi:HlyD family secretion protein
VRRKLAWLLGLLVVVAGVLVYLKYGRAKKEPEAQFKTAQVEKRRISGRVTASGTLSALVTVQVGSQVSGRISEILVDFNTPVKKGQLIARIDPALFQAAVSQAQANYLSAQANLTKAKAQALENERQFARFKALHDQGLSSKAELDLSETNLAIAKSQIAVADASLQQAAAAVNQARVNLSYTSIHSPIDGVVLSRNVDVGQTVAASLQAPVLFTIAEDLSKMQVDTSVSEGDIGRLEVGMKAFFTVDAFTGRRFRGEISQIRNAAKTTQNVVTYDAVVTVDNADGKLRPGMTANVTFIYADRESALVVPNAALRFKPPGEVAPQRTGRPQRPDGGFDGPPPTPPKTIYVLKDGKPEPVHIQTGISDGTGTEVLSGEIKEGDVVVTDTLGGSQQRPGGAQGPGGNVPRRIGL